MGGGRFLKCPYDNVEGFATPWLSLWECDALRKHAGGMFLAKAGSNL